MSNRSLKRAPTWKLSLYLTDEMVEELRREAVRQGRTQAWILMQAWKLAKSRVRELSPRWLDP